MLQQHCTQKYSLWKKCQHHLHWIKKSCQRRYQSMKICLHKKAKSLKPSQAPSNDPGVTHRAAAQCGWIKGSMISSQTPSAAAIFSRSRFQTMQTLSFFGEKASEQCWKSCLILSFSACQVYIRSFMSANQDTSIPPESEIKSMRELSSAQILQVWEQLGLGMGNGGTGIQLNSSSGATWAGETLSLMGPSFIRRSTCHTTSPEKAWVFFFFFPYRIHNLTDKLHFRHL